MLAKTSAIILSAVKYGEQKLIIKSFTKKHGLISFMISKTRKGKIKTNLFYPLSLLELDLKLHKSGQLSSLSDASPAYVFQTTGNNIIKTTISFFITEVLNKCIKEEEKNEPKFDFIFNAICFLDLLHENEHNFHLYFLLEFTKYLGFYPGGQPDAHYPCFDLREGFFVEENHSAFTLNREGTAVFLNLLNVNAANFLLYRNNYNERKYLIEKLLMYYQLHITSFGNIKSIEVLEEVLG